MLPSAPAGAMPPSASTSVVPDPSFPGCSNLPSSGMLGRPSRAFPDSSSGEGDDAVPSGSGLSSSSGSPPA
eukprot:1511538-Karenia_brevis.AAC.1